MNFDDGCEPLFLTPTTFHRGERRQWAISEGWLAVTLTRFPSCTCKSATASATAMPIPTPWQSGNVTMRPMRQRCLCPIRATIAQNATGRLATRPENTVQTATLPAQIVMVRKQPPRTAPATKDIKLDRRSPKTPPGESAGGHVDDPVGREPVGHVVVARDGHEPAADLAGSDAFAHRGRDDSRDVAIDDAGELVENDDGENDET